MLTELPVEIAIIVMLSLGHNGSSLVRLSLTCKFFHEIAHSDYFLSLLFPSSKYMRWERWILSHSSCPVCLLRRVSSLSQRLMLTQLLIYDRLNGQCDKYEVAHLANVGNFNTIMKKYDIPLSEMYNIVPRITEKVYPYLRERRTYYVRVYDEDEE